APDGPGARSTRAPRRPVAGPDGRHGGGSPIPPARDRPAGRAPRTRTIRRRRLPRRPARDVLRGPGARLVAALPRGNDGPPRPRRCPILRTRPQPTLSRAP